MANKLLTSTQVCEMFLEDIRALTGGDIKKQRAIVYDLQSSLGGFPSSEAERIKFIDTGKY